MPASSWLHHLCDFEFLLFMDFPPEEVFSTLLWLLWKERNGRIFNGHNDPMAGFLLRLHASLKYNQQAWSLKSVVKNSSGHLVLNIFWTHPRYDYFKLNVDGSSKGNPGLAGCGGVVRDFTSNWVCGFATHLGVCTSMVAELNGLLEGLNCAWDSGCRRLMVEMDSLSCVQLIRGSLVNLCLAGLLSKIRAMLQREWVVQVTHVYREANRLADLLANIAVLSSTRRRTWWSPPAAVLSILIQDRQEVA
ncbi:hypothetical protein K2173_003552 [Erythroxylum novogranatense]|uniref:RNase H type-1 domain-containing protein n=1 Tax=Erythroxylum novogranatense TaxID=1862640 RepID=A0AAV8TC88_9ROSI|nr:hypothetical protein K2173_003552 [Erythroxylum novogranatense]